MDLQNVGDRGSVFHLIRAEHIEGQVGRGGLAGHDMEQVGGRDAFGQRRP